MKSKYFKFVNEYFKNQPDFRAKLFTVLAISGILISFITCIESIITCMWETALVSLVMMVLSAIIMRYARKSGKYRQCYIITIIVIFIIFFPILFFTSGGYRGGMPAVFIFASIFTMIMLDGKKAFIMTGIELALYITVCQICYLYPHLVTQYMSEEAILHDVQFGFTSVSVACGVVVFLHLKEYDRQREDLKQKNKILKEMDEAKSTFLTTVAHEVKNPLNIISLHAQDTSELLEETELDLSQIKENQKIIEETVMRIDRVLTDLMDTVSIEQGRLKLSLAPMNLSDVIVSGAEAWKKQYSLGKIKTKIVLDLDESLKPIFADYARLYQVISNLLSNSVRHTPQGTITITLRGDESSQTVCVADDGEGMSEDMQKKALEGYVSENKDYWRHGIGLYVCHRVVEAHGGSIKIESEKGKGTKVFFTLPAREDL